MFSAEKERSSFVEGLSLFKLIAAKSFNGAKY
jgi:hypothetical protein